MVIKIWLKTYQMYFRCIIIITIKCNEYISTYEEYIYIYKVYISTYKECISTYKKCIST